MKWWLLVWGSSMDIWEANKLALFVAFVVPGFISLKTYEVLFPRSPKDSAQQLIDVVAYSSVNYALLMWPIYEIESSPLRTTYPRAHVIFWVFVLLVAPLCWAFLLGKARSSKFVQQNLPHPTAKPWDFVFGQRQRYWVIVSLKDGKRIGGFFGSKSFASSAPAPEQIYLQQAWDLNSNGGFERPRKETAGVMILAPDIVSVEFFEVLDGGDDEQEADHQ